MTMPNDRELCVLFLCYNDAATIEWCVRRTYATLQDAVSRLTVIVVNDASCDGSQEILERLRNECEGVIIVTHAKNLGYGASLYDGMKHATGDYLLCSDGDGQFDPMDGLKLLAAMDDATDVVSGVRRPRADSSYRRLTGRLCNYAVRRVLAPELEDVDCGFKLFRIRSLQSLLPVRCNMAVWVEISSHAHILSYVLKSVTIQHRPRTSGKSAAFTGRNICLLIREISGLFAGRMFAVWAPFSIKEAYWR